MLIQILILSLLLILNPVWDWWLIEVKNIGIKHRLQGFIIGVIVGTTSILTYRHTHNLWALWVALLYPSVRWFVHDFLENWFRGKEKSYVPEYQAGVEPSWADIFLRHAKSQYIKNQYAYKSAFLILSIGVVLFLNHLIK